MVMKGRDRCRNKAQGLDFRSAVQPSEILGKMRMLKILPKITQK